MSHISQDKRKHLKVLIACEFSQIVTHEFRKLGINAVSIDIEHTEGNKDWHIKDDVVPYMSFRYDLIIAFPPCTHLASSGARWFKEKRADGRQQDAIDFFMMFANANAKRIAIENPIGIMSTQYRKPDQIVQPWQFGHGETKATCLWLKNLPKLEPTNIVEGREERIHRMAPHPDRSKNRSRTYEGIAKAMAKQWGDFLCS